jgi:hypothetical protein
MYHRLSAPAKTWKVFPLVAALVFAGLASAPYKARAQTLCWTYYVDVYGDGNYRLHGGRYPTFERAYAEAVQARILGSRVSHIVNACTGQYIPFDSNVGVPGPTQSYINAIKDAYRRAVDARQRAVAQTAGLTSATFDQVSRQIQEFNSNLNSAQRQYPRFSFGVSSVPQLNAVVQYRPWNSPTWSFYGAYSTSSQAYAVANYLLQRNRGYYFRVVAQ